MYYFIQDKETETIVVCWGTWK